MSVPAVALSTALAVWGLAGCSSSEQTRSAAAEEASSSPSASEGLGGADSSSGVQEELAAAVVPANAPWPDVNADDLTYNPANPRLCIQNNTGVTFSSRNMGDIAAGSLACKLVERTSMYPVNSTMIYEEGLTNSGVCIEAQDYLMGRPDITIFKTVWVGSKITCGKKLKQFDLGENTRTSEFFYYPDYFYGSRGPDQDVEFANKTLILHIRRSAS
ncbi:MAG: hypothetical protein K9G24_06785 [Candidatus Nanopelagicales bacterium]|nr:hypothetical protein [Candidatus Nanopelagicales bacterium]MCF8537730.1 hypothetical protein [Candidatus Nanopelagicales bacterium]MCF8542770.1 hypothetical protein [Candidatus Nanopelagicales bacterium]MCF8557870.1 hypothetical protein [Candidatus Nanopelagicales bacterium]